MSVPLVVGVDQGSSHTRAVAAGLDGRLLGIGLARGACHAYDGMDVAMAAVRDAVVLALAAAAGGLAEVGPAVADVRAVCAGLTGADWPDEYELLRANIANLSFGPGDTRLTCPVRVTNDCIVALRGGTAQPYGAILVAGTGANCAVRSPSGAEFIYGYYHDDELQGGMALARAALWAVYRAHTGREPQTALTRRILEFYGLSHVDQLRRGQLEHTLPRPVHELAPLVFEAAEGGDGAAVTIVRDFANGSAGLVTAALRRFDMVNLPLDVALSGSIFKARGPLLLTALADALHADAPQARLVNARYEPVVGAALLALEQTGVDVSGERIRCNVDESARRLGLVREV